MKIADEKLSLEIGVWLTNKRKAVGLTQKDVQRAAKYRSPQYISNIERGLITPSFEFLMTAIPLYRISKKEALEFLESAHLSAIRRLYGEFEKKSLEGKALVRSPSDKENLL